MIRRIFVALAFAATALSMLTLPSQAALNFDGQSGVFLNPLAYPLKANSVEIATHSVDMDDLGSIQTYNVSLGLKGNAELGFTKYSSQITGVLDQNILQGKWQFVPETKTSPAVALWVVHRDLVDGPNDTEIGVTFTKVVNVGKHPVVLDIGARSTKSLGLGLFGVGGSRETRIEGAVGLFVTSKFVVATEFKQQIDARPWHDIAFRYVASPNFNIDFGIANFSNTLDNQVAFAFTYSR